MSKEVLIERIQEIAKGYFPTSVETMVNESTPPLTFTEVNSRYQQFDDRVYDYLKDYDNELDDNDKCEVIALIKEYCKVSLKIAMSWLNLSTKLQNFYVLERMQKNRCYKHLICQAI
jgi:hypothetical protein